MQSVMPRKKKPSPKTTGFGARLVELRKLRGMTQIELADKLNATQRAITYYENEAAYPPVATIIELAKILRVSADELLGIKATKRRNGAPDGAADPEMQRLWKKFQQVAKLPDKDQRAVIRLINSVAKAS